MSNQNVSNIPKIYPKFKCGVKFGDADYVKAKNQMYYKEIKADPVRAKTTHINYYKKKYGEEFTRNAIEKYGLSDALVYLRNYKYEMKEIANENPFSTLMTGIMA